MATNNINLDKISKSTQRTNCHVLLLCHFLNYKLDDKMDQQDAMTVRLAIERLTSYCTAGDYKKDLFVGIKMRDLAEF